MIQATGRREAEKALGKARLPYDFSAHREVEAVRNPYQRTFFRCQNELMKVMARKLGFDLSMIVIKLSEGEELTSDERKQLSLLFKQVARTTLRKTDQIFDILAESTEINIVLPGTRAAKAEVVIDKLRGALQAQKGKMAERGRLTFSVETLHEEAVA